MLSLGFICLALANGIVIGWLLGDWSQDQAFDSAKRRIERDRIAIARLNEEIALFRAEQEATINRIFDELGATEIIDW